MASPSGSSAARPTSPTAGRPSGATRRTRGRAASRPRRACRRGRGPGAVREPLAGLRPRGGAHAATFPSRADEYGRAIRTKLDAAQRVDPDAVLDGYRALLEWRQLVPEVDLYVSPCVAIDWRGTRTSSRCASALVLHALGQPPRLGRPRDRQPAADRTGRRDRAGRRARLGARLTSAGRRADALVGEQAVIRRQGEELDVVGLEWRCARTASVPPRSPRRAAPSPRP